MAYDPDRELAKQIRDKQITGTEATDAVNKLGGIPTTAPAAGTPTAPAPVQTPSMVNLRDAATQGGAQIGWSPEGGVTINGNPINTTGLTNYGGKAPAGYSPNAYYGTQEQIDALLSPYVYKGKNDVQPAADAYNKWANSDPNLPYEQELNNLVKDVLSRTFQYDSANDAQFQSAAKELTRNILETNNARGLVNSTIASQGITQGVADLLPQYQQIARQNFQDEGTMLMSQVDMLTGIQKDAYNRFQDEGTRLAGALDVVMKMDNDQYTKWQNAYTNRYNAQKDEQAAAAAKIEADRQKVKDAWEDVQQRGYTTNETALILKIDPSTLSKDAREAKIKRQQELEDKEISLKNQKEMALYQFNLSKKLADYKGASTSDPSTLGDAKQVQNYNSLRDIYFGGGGGTYANKPLDAYNWLMSHAKENRDLIGDKLYNRLLTELTDMMGTQKTYGEKGTTEAQDFTQQNTIYAQAIAMKNEIIEGRVDPNDSEADPLTGKTPDIPKYTNEQITQNIVNSGLDDTPLKNVLLKVFSEQELRDMGLWEDAPQQ